MIDSLDILENDANEPDDNWEDQTEQYIRSLVSMLASHTQTSEDATTSTITNTTQQIASSSASTSISSSLFPRLFKVLFTTTGQCRAIQSTLVDQGLGQVISTGTAHIANEPFTDNNDDIVMAEG